jgi:hypothetical protein
VGGVLLLGVAQLEALAEFIESLRRRQHSIYLQ